MEDILDGGGSGETLNITSDGISVERDSLSHHLNAYVLPINARGTERIEPTKSSFHCAKEFRCARIWKIKNKVTFSALLTLFVAHRE